MEITGICVTYNRPGFLGRLIHCFEQQDDPNARLLILDDAGQYLNQSGNRWVLVSKKDRYSSLGHKRNAAVKLACDHFPGTKGIAIMDDDDVYWPYAMSAVSAALEKGDWARPTVVYEPVERSTELTKLRRVQTRPDHQPQLIAYGGSWAWRRATLEKLGGYPPVNNGEDANLAEEAFRRFGPSVDLICPEFPEPGYLYHRREIGEHMSDWPDPYANRKCDKVKLVSEISVGWNGPNCYELPVEPGIAPRPW